MLKIAVCDDEAELRAELMGRIERYAAENGVDCETAGFASGGELLEAGGFHIVFLDIQMPGQSGMETAAALRGRGFSGQIIFVTVLSDCVYDAFGVDAADFLVKPVSESRFESALGRAVKKAKGALSGTLFIQTPAWRRSVRFDDILYCEVINRKVYIHTASGVIDYYSTMEALQARLDSRFFKCHRSYLVNLRYVSGYAGGMAELEGGARVPVSRLRGRDFMQAMLRYMDGG